jgi:hypothetical protein
MRRHFEAYDDPESDEYMPPPRSHPPLADRPQPPRVQTRRTPHNGRVQTQMATRSLQSRLADFAEADAEELGLMLDD